MNRGKNKRNKGKLLAKDHGDIANKKGNTIAQRNTNMTNNNQHRTNKAGWHSLSLSLWQSVCRPVQSVVTFCKLMAGGGSIKWWL